jgi:hypothetical protein
MALTDENGGGNMVMPVAPMNGNNGFGGFGDGSWLILFIIMIMCGGWGGGFGGFGGFGGGFGYDFPWLLNGQNGINANTNAGFQNAAVQSAIGDVHNSIVSGFGDVQNALCGGFAGVNATVNGAQNAISQQLYTNQIADLERSFAAQTANTQGMTALQSQLAQCCFDNRLATANLGSDIAREACATRTNDTQNTQAILNTINGGIQSIKDQLCADKIDAKNDEIANLRQSLAMKDLAASQIAQNAFISQGFANEVDQLYNRLNSCPVPTTPVYGRTPIFTCNGQNYSGGCGCSFAA